MEDSKEPEQPEGGLGHHAVTVVIRNRGSSVCVLSGVPTLEFVDAANQPLAVTVCQNCDAYLFRSQPVREIHVGPKSPAYVVVAYNINNGAEGDLVCRNALALRLYLPGQSEPLKSRLGQGRDGIRSCGPVDVTPFLEKPLSDGFLADPAYRQ